MGNFLYRILRLIVQTYFNLKYNITVYNREKLPNGGKYYGGYIIACNHQKYADPPALAAVVKGRFSFIAKAELFKKNPFFAVLIRICGAFPVVRGGSDNAALDRAVKDLKKNKIFVIFPEGTRSKDGKIGRGKSGVALIAAMANVPVLPACIMYKLGGSEKNLDMAFGDVIPAEEINMNLTNGELPDRKMIKQVSERIMNSIIELQAQILSERGETL